MLTYLLTPWSRVLLEKLTGSAASQEIPRIFGTRRFITVLKSARHYIYIYTYLRSNLLQSKKLTIEQTIKAQRRSRGIALLFL